MTPQAVKVYIRTQGIIAAIINAVITPLLAWLGNPKMEFMTLSESHSLIIDTAATCVLLSLLVALFATAGVRRDLKNYC